MLSLSPLSLSPLSLSLSALSLSPLSLLLLLLILLVLSLTHSLAFGLLLLPGGLQNVLPEWPTNSF